MCGVDGGITNIQLPTAFSTNNYSYSLTILASGGDSTTRLWHVALKDKTTSTITPWDTTSAQRYIICIGY